MKTYKYVLARAEDDGQHSIPAAQHTVDKLNEAGERGFRVINVTVHKGYTNYLMEKQ